MWHLWIEMPNKGPALSFKYIGSPYPELLHKKDDIPQAMVKNRYVGTFYTVQKFVQIIVYLMKICQAKQPGRI